MLEEIRSLPPLPNSIMRIQQICAQEDTNIVELSGVIEKDPMLSANILKSVNSPLYGLSKEISSISRAVMLFGISMIKGFAASSIIKKTIITDLSAYHVDIDKLSDISAVQTALAKEWYGKVDKSMLPMLQTASFLMELGKFITSLKIIDLGKSDEFYNQIKSLSDFSSIEIELLGVSSYQIAAKMFEHWNFEVELVEILSQILADRVKNNHSKVLSVIACAVNTNGYFTETNIEKSLELCDRYNLDRDSFLEAVEILKSRD